MATGTQERAMRFIDVMLEHVERCKYPSKDMMDRVERAMVMFWDEERTDEAA
jgi:hypothetical protein